MHVSASDVNLMAHATFGVLGTLAALWVLVEALNASSANAGRTRTAAKLVVIFMSITAVVAVPATAKRNGKCNHTRRQPWALRFSYRINWPKRGSPS